jgi:hypothetical protein
LRCYQAEAGRDSVRKQNKYAGEAEAGHSIDPAGMARFIGPAGLVIAHNASFERSFAGVFCDAFVAKPWTELLITISLPVMYRIVR